MKKQRRVKGHKNKRRGLRFNRSSGRRYCNEVKISTAWKGGFHLLRGKVVFATKDEWKEIVCQEVMIIYKRIRTAVVSEFPFTQHDMSIMTEAHLLFSY